MKEHDKNRKFRQKRGTTFSLQDNSSYSQATMNKVSFYTTLYTIEPTYLVRYSCSVASGYRLRYGNASNLTYLVPKWHSFLNMVTVISWHTRWQTVTCRWICDTRINTV